MSPSTVSFVKREREKIFPIFALMTAVKVCTYVYNIFLHPLKAVAMNARLVGCRLTDCMRNVEVKKTRETRMSIELSQPS